MPRRYVNVPMDADEPLYYVLAGTIPVEFVDITSYTRAKTIANEVTHKAIFDSENRLNGPALVLRYPAGDPPEEVKRVREERMRNV